MENFLYNIEDKLPIKKLLLFSIQMLLSVFVATALIASIIGVNMSAALVGAGCSSLIYSFITKGRSPMFISNSGAFIAPILMALTVAGYTGIAVGGFVTFLVYSLFGIIFTKISIDNIYKVFPPALIGAITMVIGINLMSFIPTCIGTTGQWGTIIALITMFTIALVSHYSTGVFKVLPFLIGILVGYACSIIVTYMGLAEIIDLSVFKDMEVFVKPVFAFTLWEPINFTSLISIIIVYIAFTISAMMECLSDHAALSGIIGVDLYRNPGLGRIFIGEGAANLASTCLGGIGACSYGEGVACVGFSKVASTQVTRVAAGLLVLLGFIGPVQIFIASIPTCVFAGAAIVLYGFISMSGAKQLQKVDLNNNKNLIIVSTVLSIGISGLVLGSDTVSLQSTALALVIGIILNLILKEKKC